MKAKRLIALLAAVSLLFLLLPGSPALAEEAAEEPASDVREEAAEGSMSAQLEAIFTTEDLLTATIEDLSAAMERGSLTSVRLTQMYLDRIEVYDHSLDLNTMITLNENALAEAAAADEARAAGQTGLLLGIPILVKDNINVEGLPTTNGHSAYKNRRASSDAASVAALRAQGAVFLGKTNMATDAQTGFCSRSDAGGRVHNAYDLSRTPAGSSGGSAVAAAGCFCAAALGSDTGSSIRRPSCYANLYGLRPSYDLVSREGLTSLSRARDTVGPMCRYAEDTARLLAALTGDSSYLEALSGATLEGKRIGLLANSFGYYYTAYDVEIIRPTEADPLLKEMYERALAALEDAGAELVDISGVLKERTIQNITFNNRLTSRGKINTILEENNIDAVLYMSQWGLPMKENKASDYYDNYADYINTFGPLCGLPEITLPMGLSAVDSARGYDYGLAMGLNLFSAYGKDTLVLEIAAAYEQAGTWRVSPQTTPALPDENLELFAQSLWEAMDELEEELYTEESYAALQEAREAAASLRMKTAEELVSEVLGKGTASADSEDTRQPVGVSEYKEALAAAAQAYDSLELRPEPEPEPGPEPEPESESEPAAEPEEQEMPEQPKEDTTEAPEHAQSVQRFFLPVVAGIVLLLIVTLFLVLRPKRHKRNR